MRLFRRSAMMISLFLLTQTPQGRLTLPSSWPSNANVKPVQNNVMCNEPLMEKLHIVIVCHLLGANAGFTAICLFRPGTACPNAVEGIAAGLTIDA